MSQDVFLFFFSGQARLFFFALFRDKLFFFYSLQRQVIFFFQNQRQEIFLENNPGPPRISNGRPLKAGNQKDHPVQVLPNRLHRRGHTEEGQGHARLEGQGNIDLHLLVPMHQVIDILVVMVIHESIRRL